MKLIEQNAYSTVSYKDQVPIHFLPIPDDLYKDY